MERFGSVRAVAMSASVRPTFSEHGSICVYRWELKEGESVPIHDHTDRPMTKHITIVASGTILISIPDLGEDWVVNGPTIFDYSDKQQKHSIKAITDTVFFNVIRA